MKERKEEGRLNPEEAKQSQALWDDLVNGVFNPQTVLQTHFGHLGNDLNQEAIEKITQDFLQHASVGKSASDIQTATRNLDAVINAAPFVSNNERAKIGSTNSSQASLPEAVTQEQESDQAIKAKYAKNEAEANQVTPTRDEPTQKTSPQPEKISFIQRVKNAIQTVREIASNAKENIDKKAKQAKVSLFKKLGLGRDSVTPIKETKPIEATLTSIDSAATNAKSQVDTVSNNAQQRLDAMEVAFLDRLREKVEAKSEARLTEGTPEFDQIIKEIEAEKNSAEPVLPSEHIQSQSLEEVDASIDAFVNEVHGNIDATEKSFTDNLLRELEDAEISDADIDQLVSELGEMPSNKASEAIPEVKSEPTKRVDEALKKSPDQMMAELDAALDMIDEPAKAAGPKADGPAKLDVPTIPSPITPRNSG